MINRSTCNWLFILPGDDQLLCMLSMLTECPHSGDITICSIAEQKAYDPDIQLPISEIYPAISGEGTSTGKICTIVRLTGCNLRCQYCDTVYAYEDDKSVALKDVIAAVLKFGMRTVLFTGGEPLLHEQPASHFLRAMLEHKIITYVETNGSINIWPFKVLSRIVMDIKTPSSTMHEQMYWDNLKYLGVNDEIKFVVADENDYNYATTLMTERRLLDITPNVFISPAWSEDKEFVQILSQWMIRDISGARLMLQQHKYIWGPSTRSV